MISVLYVNILIWVLICLDACMLKWSLGCLSKQSLISVGLFG